MFKRTPHLQTYNIAKTVMCETNFDPSVLQKYQNFTTHEEKLNLCQSVFIIRIAKIQFKLSTQEN